MFIKLHDKDGLEIRFNVDRIMLYCPDTEKGKIVGSIIRHGIEGYWTVRETCEEIDAMIGVGAWVQ